MHVPPLLYSPALQLGAVVVVVVGAKHSEEDEAPVAPLVNVPLGQAVGDEELPRQ
jgi:hypothetical protein